MQTLNISWRRLVDNHQTCPRCGDTETELTKAVAALKQALSCLGIEVVFQKEALSLAEFQKDPLRSNQVWLNNRLLEDWVGGATGQSQCCDVCGTAECRTVGVAGMVYESLPAELLIKAGLLAAAQIIGARSGEVYSQNTKQ